MQTMIPALVIARTFEAPPERVYRAWTDPALASQFFCPSGVTFGGARFDVRVGGSFRIEMKSSSGEDFNAYGVYREVKPNARLVMTWRWEEDDPKDEVESLLTIDLKPHGSGTELTLTHERLASLESRARHEEGWCSILEKMEALR